MNSILFDIGATKTRMAFWAGGKEFEEPKVWETPQSYEEGLKKFIESAEELAGDREINIVCGGMSRSVWAAHSAGAGNYGKFKNDLTEAFEAAVYIENDAAMAGLGEANFGAGRGEEIVAYITVSTGVGGARIINGQIDEYAVGFEPGKQIMDAESGETLEQMISGKSLAQRSGKHPKEITDEEVWDDLANKLGVGLNNIIVEWSPSCVVLGGSMITGDPAIPLEKSIEKLKEILKVFPEVPLVKKAELGDFGGLFGSLAYVTTMASDRSNL